MISRKYFPLGKAHGEAFCNRGEETQWLTANMDACKHSLLIAARRFGKSSLCDKAISVSKRPSITLNFNTCSDENDIDTLIRQGVSRLIGKSIGQLDKLTQLIKRYVTHLTPKINIGNHISLELSPVDKDNPIANITEALELIEKLLAHKKKHAVLVMDEFQAIGEIADGKGVEAAIRNVIQDNTFLTVIFSGSNRHLLKIMFEDDTRPLYKLCRKKNLTRISEQHYKTHLNTIAKKTWHKELDDNTFNTIMTLTERHPYYVNYLCDILWTDSKTLPSVATVNKAWLVVLDEEYSDTNKDISGLSPGQKKVLSYIAKAPNNKLSSQEASLSLSMPISSISGAVNKLIEKDLVEKTENTHLIINPVLKAVLIESIPTF